MSGSGRQHSRGGDRGQPRSDEPDYRQREKAGDGGRARSGRESAGGAADERPRSAASGRPPRAPANPLMAEVARLAKQRMEEQAAKGAADSDEGQQPRPASRGGWRAAMEDAGETPEDGELPSGRGGGGAAAAAAAATGGGVEDDEAAAASRKRKHAPIVWHTPPKNPRGADMAHVDSSSGLVALDAAGVPPLAAGTAAERAMAEVMAFQQQQEQGEGEEPFMKPSPDVSSQEEEEHIRREGTARRGPDAGGSGTEPSSGAAPPEGEQGAAAEEEEEQEEEAPSVPPPKRTNRWNTGDAEAGEPSQGALPGYAAAAAAAGDAKQQQGAAAGSPEPGASGGSPGGGSGLDGSPPPAAFKREISMLEECRSVESYEKLNRISEGTYGVVYRARDRDTGEICALKKVKLDKERDGFPLTSVREINILLSLDHNNIVNVSEVVVGPSLDAVFMVMEYADHDLKAVMEDRMTQPFSTAEVKTLMVQLLSGMAYLHEHWVLHRDLKTSNILYTNKGELKICDFGLARQYGSPLAPYTHMVVTLWYRSPELLLGQKLYSTAVDVWSCGCIMGELLGKEPLFQGRSEIDQLQAILKLMGSPTEESWPGLNKLPGARKFNLGKYAGEALRQRFPPAGVAFDARNTLSEAGFDLLSRLLELCPERRISCADALDHPWFTEHPLPKDRALMPTFPATNDSTHGSHHAARRVGVAKPPQQPQQSKPPLQK